MNTRIYADFNKLDQNRNAILVCKGTMDDLQQQRIELVEDMEVTLYMPDDVDAEGQPDCLEVNAIVKYDNEHGYWVGEFQWDELGYKSEKKRT